MASGTQSAIINFPTGVDFYYTKLDRGVIVSGESHLIPFSAPYQFYTTHTPLFGSPGTTTSIPGFTEVTVAPSTNQYLVDYSGNNASRFTFSSFNAGNLVSVTYTADGDTIVAEWFNSLQTSVTGIENYIVSNSGNSGNVRITGSSMTGNLTMNGSNILTAASGTNQVGTTSSPFSQVIANTVAANLVESFDGLDTIALGGDLNISGHNALTLVSNGNVKTSGSNDVYIVSEKSGVHIAAVDGVIFDASALPTGSFVYDLGTSTKRWKTLFVDNIDATTNPYVRVTGDTMSGSLTMGTGASINTDSINNATTSLTITSTADITETAAGNINLSASFFDVNAGILSVTPLNATVGGNFVPTVSGTFDLGTASSTFRTIYADSIQGAAASGAFVKITGDSMSGDLTMAFGTAVNTNNINSAAPSGLLTVSVGEFALTAANNIHFDTGPSGTQKLEIGLTEISLSTNVIPTVTGLYDIGAASLPLRAIYADNLHINAIASGTTIQGATFGNPTFTGTVTLGTGASITSAGSGTVNFGSLSNPIGTIYASSIVTAQSTGNFISKFGDTMIGNLALGTGSNITAVGSGVNNIGSASNPIGTLYANNVVSSGANGLYVLKTGDSMSGPLVLNKVYSTGTLVISGNQINESAEQVNVTSTNGPIILNTNTEMQMLVNSVPNLTLNVSGTESFLNIFPDTSGTHSLGTPQRPWDAIYATNIIPVGTSGTGNFVLKVGDTMTGGLNFTSGIGIILLQSGTSNIGTPASPLKALYADNLVITSPSGAFVHVSGDTMTGPLTINSNLVVTGNMTSTLGNLSVNAGTISSFGNITTTNGSVTVTHPGALFTTNIRPATSAGISIFDSNGLGGIIGITSAGNGVGNAGTIDLFAAAGFVSRGRVTLNGDAVDGSTVVVSGSTLLMNGNINILNAGSGVNTVGNAAHPFSGAYYQNINGRAATYQIYNEIPSGTVDGLNATFTTITAPVSGTQRIYAGGLRQTPGSSFDYQISGNMFTFTNVPPSGTNLLIDYERLAF